MGLLSRIIGPSKGQPRKASDDPMVSLVILLREPLNLDASRAREALDSLFPGAFAPPNDGSFVIEGPSAGQLMVKSVVPANSGLFALNCVAAPYTDFSPFLAHVTDPLLRGRIDLHQAWVSLDRLAAIGSDDDAYRFIGKALTCLAPQDSIAIVHPETLVAVPFHAETRDRLRRDDVLAALGAQRG